MKRLKKFLFFYLCIIVANASIAQDKKVKTTTPVISTFTISAQTIKIGSAEHKTEWPTSKPSIPPKTPISISVDFLNDSTLSMVVKDLPAADVSRCKCAGLLSINGNSVPKLSSSENSIQAQQAQNINRAAYRTIEFISASEKIFKTTTDAQGAYTFPSMPPGIYKIKMGGMFYFLDYSF